MLFGDSSMYLSLMITGSIFPSIILFFALIPYIPITGIQETLMDLLTVVLPPSTNEITFNTLDVIINNPRIKLLSIGKNFR